MRPAASISQADTQQILAFSTSPRVRVSGPCLAGRGQRWCATSFHPSARLSAKSSMIAVIVGIGQRFLVMLGPMHIPPRWRADLRSSPGSPGGRDPLPTSTVRRKSSSSSPLALRRSRSRTIRRPQFVAASTRASLGRFDNVRMPPARRDPALDDVLLPAPSRRRGQSA